MAMWRGGKVRVGFAAHRHRSHSCIHICMLGYRNWVSRCFGIRSCLLVLLVLGGSLRQKQHEYCLQALFALPFPALWLVLIDCVVKVDSDIDSERVFIGMQVVLRNDCKRSFIAYRKTVELVFVTLQRLQEGEAKK